MTIEAFAGKNPVSHVGKTYSVVAQRVAIEVARRTGASRAECILVSKIGQPVDQPGLAHVRVRGPDPEDVRSVVATVLDEQLARAGTVWRDLLGWED
jgi:S-adenosylmethionine synthetase